jgi:hypothetical protein
MTPSDRYPEINSKSGATLEEGDLDSLSREEYEFPAGGLAEAWDFDETWQGRFAALVRRTAVRGLWVLLAALLALGSAGLAAATGQAPTPGHRLELTYAADKQLSSRLDDGVRALSRLNDDVIYLGKLARDVLASVSQVNQVKLAAD